MHPKLCHVAISQLGRLEVQRWASELPGAADTVRKMVNVLSRAQQLAVEDGRIVANPAVRLRLPKVVQVKKRYLRHEQVASLAIAVDDRSHGSDLGHGLLVVVLACCGLRWGQLSGRSPRCSRRTDPHPAGRPQLPRRLVRSGSRADQTDAARAPAHCVSLAVCAGANVKAVQRMVGHPSAEITLDRYADLFEDDLDAVAVALDRAALQTDVSKMWAHRPDGLRAEPGRNEETPD